MQTCAKRLMKIFLTLVMMSSISSCTSMKSNDNCTGFRQIYLKQGEAIKLSRQTKEAILGHNKFFAHKCK